MSGIPAGAGSLLGKRLGKYEILALLALGGTAEIYLARIGGAAGFEKYVVVKCLHDHLADDQEFVKMFLDEARLAAHLDHSNIVQTMELGEYENRYYMVMEFLAGLSLAMIVRRAGERIPGGKIPVPLVLNMLAQASAGLHYAHERVVNGKPLGIVHRDISPQNLVVSFEGVVKVVDFGIAKAELRETRTRSGTIKGKFAYMSPEQCVANNVDRRTDVFALGVIAHELLTGRRLFKKPSPYETYQAVIECNVDPPSKMNVELDPALDPIIMKAIAKDRDQRYQTAEAFGDALLGYLHHRGKGSGPGDVARFFDSTFAQEIDEHGARMRELIEGRDFSVDTGVNWGEDDAKANETVDLGAARSGDDALSLDSMDLEELSRSGSASLSGEIDAVGGDDDDMPVDKTRIESNPLERLQELDKVVASGTTGSQPRIQADGPGKTGKTPPPESYARTQMQPAATPPKGQAVMPPSGALPLPPAPVAPSKAGKFADPADVKTVISDDADPMEFAPTALGGHDIADLDPSARPNMAMQAPQLPNGVGPLPGPMPPRPQPAASPLLSGYPVLNAELSAQIATGATVFPSEHQQRPSFQNMQRPTHDSGPRGVHDSGPQLGPPMHPSAPHMQPPGMHGHDPSRAVDMASPVGPRYGDQVDWAAAAAAPARAIPPWMLAVLFVLAIGVALGITIVIARLAR
ncbi:MAG TPA: serine/threonine-protein kinase [Kofleriaceae bacterium]|nr:serine/threonine-protein kinase [Kofleriaceae bacterium]